MNLTIEQKRNKIAEIPFWWHSVDLGDGVVTPGSNSIDKQNKLLSVIPVDMTGKSALDIGAWDGVYSFGCEKRGAEVTAIDVQECEGLLLAKEILDSGLTFHRMSLFDIPSKLARSFDVVLFFGVLYHLKNPLGALEILADITRELLVLETHIIPDNADTPVMKFYPGNELGNEPSNWWGPNARCVTDMLKVAGFKTIKPVTGYGKGSRLLLQAYK